MTKSKGKGLLWKELSCRALAFFPVILEVQRYYAKTDFPTYPCPLFVLYIAPAYISKEGQQGQSQPLTGHAAPAESQGDAPLSAA